MTDEQKAAIKDVMEQCEKVRALHARMLRTPGKISETDAMMVRRLIRTLVAEWV